MIQFTLTYSFMLRHVSNGLFILESEHVGLPQLFLLGLFKYLSSSLFWKARNHLFLKGLVLSGLDANCVIILFLDLQLFVLKLEERYNLYNERSDSIKYVQAHIVYIFLQYRCTNINIYMYTV